MNILTWDVETTTYAKGNPYSQRNRMVSVGWKLNDQPTRDAYMDDPTGLEAFKTAWQSADVLVGYNAKFDMAHCRKHLGLVVADNQQVYCVQLAWFVLTNQQHRYPSLNQVLEYFGLPIKLDVVKTQYWDKGIDTPDIPRDVLSEYLHHDVESTYQAYLKVKEAMPASKRKLVQLQMADLIVLHCMEFEGLRYDKETSLKLAEETRKELDSIDSQLTDLVGIAGVNFGSGDQLSAILYGGTIVQEHKEEYLFQYKDPKKAPVIKTRKVEREYPMPRLVEPLPRTELKKEGLYATNESTLKSLKAKGKGKAIIDLVLRRAKLEKLNSSYYIGIPKLMDEMDWPEGEIHHTLNQCTAVTGRLSSERPNGQNMGPEVKKLLISRY
jgi:DNA polymerase I-like protein with 3'-5' exonuclease and polymerase domains